MTANHYKSKTGLYSIRLWNDLIHEGLTVIQVEEFLDYYKRRYEDESVEWAFDPSQLSVEEFSGTYKLTKK